MTVKLSVSVPDDVAAYLRAQGNASAAVTAAMRRMLPEVDRARRRETAQAYGEYLRQHRQSSDADVALIESSNDIAIRGLEW